MTAGCLAELAEYLARPDTDHHDVGSASAIRELAQHYLLLVDDLDNSERLRHQAEADRKTLMLQMALGQAALKTAFDGAVRCVDALAGDEDDRYFAELAVGPGVELLTTAALLGGGK